MSDTSATIARDLVAEIGRASALLYLARLWWAEGSWRGTARWAGLAWAVVLV